MDGVLRWLGVRARAIGRWIVQLQSRAILLIGWLVFLEYAYPGYMSYDSIQQLGEARSGRFGDWHPPAMAALWRLIELVVAGPVGMLVIQSGCFLIGAYLVLMRAMSTRAAAVCASCLLWFPPIGVVMAVIWKDSQMAGFLMLGTGLLCAAARRDRLLGVALLLLASMMRHNAFTMTFPLVVLLFVWRLDSRGWRRYAVGLAVWVAITGMGALFSSRLTRHHDYTWYRSSALIDIVGTLNYAEPISDEQLRPLLEGVRVIPTHDLQQAARRAYNPAWTFDVIWNMERRFFDDPANKPQRLAVVRAWKKIVLGHPYAFLTYRAEIFLHLLGLGPKPPDSPIYVGFSDLQDPFGSAQRALHLASASRIQQKMQLGMLRLGLSSLFHPYLYALLAILLLPFSLRDRLSFALLASGLVGEAALYFVAPTGDYRYSIWLVIVDAAAVMILIARRAGATPAVPMLGAGRAISDATGPRRR